MSVLPEGDAIRKAVKYVSDERKFNAKKKLKALVDEACIKFNLSPKEADFLTRFVLEELD